VMHDVVIFKCLAHGISGAGERDSLSIGWFVVRDRWAAGTTWTQIYDNLALKNALRKEPQHNAAQNASLPNHGVASSQKKIARFPVLKRKCHTEAIQSRFEAPTTTVSRP